MPSQSSIDRNYYITTLNDLSTIPLREGNVISLSDTDGLYYDIGNPAGSGTNVIRRKASSLEFVDSLSEARHEPYTIFIVTENNMTTGYSWDDTLNDFYAVFNNSAIVDHLVESIDKTSSWSNKAYIVGSEQSGTYTGTLVKNSNVYITTTGKIHADIEGNVDTATNATNATNATVANRATNDNAATPKPITNYLYNVDSDYQSNPGTKLTFTLGNGTTKIVQISDTKYQVFTSDPNTLGLVNGINTTVDSDSTDLVLSGSGWISLDNLSIPHSASATNDGNGNAITSTYYASASFNTSTRKLTLTKGNGSTVTELTIPDTTYTVFSTSSNGLVPAASGTGTSAKFLRGDGTWQSPEDAIGIYQGSNPGLVPSAGSGNTGKYLKNDGTWGGVFSTSEMGLVPTPSVSSASYSLKSNGTWTADIDTKNTAGSTNDTSNMIYLVGAREQSSNPQTYSNANVYISGNKLYQSNGSTPVQVVDVSSAQNLENKTFNGNPLGTAAFADASNSVTPDQLSVTDDFTGDGTTTDFTLTETLTEITSVTIDSVATSAYTVDAVNNAISFTSAPTNNSAIEVIYTTPDPTYDSNDLPTNIAVINYTNTRISGIQNDLSAKLNAGVVADIYDNTATYAVDDFCMYDDGNGAKLYRCITAITVAEDFDSQKWVNMTLISAIKYLIANS